MPYQTSVVGKYICVRLDVTHLDLHHAYLVSFLSPPLCKNEERIHCSRGNRNLVPPRRTKQRHDSTRVHGQAYEHAVFLLLEEFIGQALTSHHMLFKRSPYVRLPQLVILRETRLHVEGRVGRSLSSVLRIQDRLPMALYGSIQSVSIRLIFWREVSRSMSWLKSTKQRPVSWYGSELRKALPLWLSN